MLRACCPCGGEQFTIGVLIDYASLPQPTRTHAELTRFKLGLRALTTWFAHPYVPTLPSNSPPKGGDYQNTRSVSERGWLEFERRLTYLAKSRPCLWDLAGLKLQALEEQTDARRKFDLMRSMMMTHTSPPLAPSSFTLMMQKKIKDGRLSFSNKGDLKVVLDMYHAACQDLRDLSALRPIRTARDLLRPPGGGGGGALGRGGAGVRRAKVQGAADERTHHRQPRGQPLWRHGRAPDQGRRQVWQDIHGRALLIGRRRVERRA